MQFKYYFLCFMLITDILFAQDIFIGGSGTIGIINNNSNTGLGLGINGEYRPVSVPFSFRLSAKVYNSEFDISQLYLVTYTHTLKTVDFNILYIPIRGMIQPYFGFGIGYNFINLDLSGNVKIIDNKLARSKNPKDTFNYNFLFGSSFISEKRLSIFIELLYSMMELKYEVELEDQYANKSFINSIVSLNKLLINVGIRLRI